ncbi:DUF2150 domain-containing protein [Halobacteriales archaeon QS_4_70_19]|nr:MAG: DUF2150 domain-containing protein [Halobacteriales archaeon QS_4_70_19]
MSTPPDEYYTAERWENWVDRLREEDLDPEEEESARFLWNLRDDAAIAVAKIVTAAAEEGELDDETALAKLEEMRNIVFSEVRIDDEDKTMLIQSVQASLEPVLSAAEEFVANAPADEASAAEYVDAAIDAGNGDDLDAAFAYCAQAGTRIFAGDEIDTSIVEDIEHALVLDWVNGLDSLQSALADPEVVEEED